MALTVNSKIFCEVFIFAKLRSFVKVNPREMAKSLCHLLMKVYHVIVAIFYVANAGPLFAKDAFRSYRSVPPVR